MRAARQAGKQRRRRWAPHSLINMSRLQNGSVAACCNNLEHEAINLGLDGVVVLANKGQAAACRKDLAITGKASDIQCSANMTIVTAALSDCVYSRDAVVTGGRVTCGRIFKQAVIPAANAFVSM